MDSTRCVIKSSRLITDDDARLDAAGTGLDRPKTISPTLIAGSMLPLLTI